MRFGTAILTLALSASAVFGQRPADTMTGTFCESIRTLTVGLDGDDSAPPVIIPGTEPKLNIAFDHLSDDRDYFRYSLTHCNAIWQPDGLLDSEFLDGFNEGTIDNFEYSRGTTVPYVHYWFSLPNENMSPLISGNYLLRIYPESNPDSVVAQCRFMVSEATAPVTARVSSQTDIDYNQGHQQLTIEVNTERAQVEDPFNDIMIVVGQNGRLDSEVSLRQPLRSNGKSVIYEHQKPLIFEAGNEYRRFETVNERYPGMSVDFIEFNDPYYHFALITDESRDEDRYSYDQTQHGRLRVRRQNAADSDTEAEYVIVHFTLSYPGRSDAVIFLDGDFTYRRFDDNSRMYYNENSGLYERAMLLKQGAYNYQYLIVPPGAAKGHTAAVEGNKYQTTNEYFIRVYHRRRGDRYDRMIGSALISNFK